MPKRETDLETKKQKRDRKKQFFDDFASTKRREIDRRNEKIRKAYAAQSRTQEAPKPAPEAPASDSGRSFYDRFFAGEVDVDEDGNEIVPGAAKPAKKQRAAAEPREEVVEETTSEPGEAEEPEERKRPGERKKKERHPMPAYLKGAQAKWKEHEKEIAKAERERLQKEKERKRSKFERAQRNKLFTRRTKTGQPQMSGDNVNDLSSMRASRAEIEERRAQRQSHNLEAARQELRERREQRLLEARYAADEQDEAERERDRIAAVHELASALAALARRPPPPEDGEYEEDDDFYCDEDDEEADGEGDGEEQYYDDPVGAMEAHLAHSPAKPPPSALRRPVRVVDPEAELLEFESRRQRQQPGPVRPQAPKLSRVDELELAVETIRRQLTIRTSELEAVTKQRDQLLRDLETLRHTTSRTNSNTRALTPLTVDRNETAGQIQQLQREGAASGT
eukprot:m51a1_g5597 hypothetical protein (452) ;mRNA; f:670268-672825